MPSCRELGCVGLATDARGLCALHVAGYRRHNTAAELRCDNCRRLLVKGEWYKHDGETVLHAAKQCTTHPEVVREREKQKAATA